MGSGLRILLALAGAMALFLTVLGCGSDGSGGADGCPGTVCNSCAGSGDCPNLDCSGGEVLFCGHFGFFSDPDLRCTFCADENFQP